jgi:hypothetical protein
MGEQKRNEGEARYIDLRVAEIEAHRPRDPRRQWWVGDPLMPYKATRREVLAYRWRLWRWNRRHPELAAERVTYRREVTR